MRTKKIMAAALVAAVMGGASMAASASWQGTFYYYSEEGVLVGSYTAGCGAADGQWGEVTAERHFVQGCLASS